MIVLDSSAVLAVLFGEAEAERVLDEMAAATRVVMSPVNHVETIAVLLSRRGDAGVAEYEGFFRDLGADLHPVDAAIAAAAADAYRHYGKGRHPAGLNLGDCFAYATARVLAAPLLYVGEDFGRTDLKAI